MAVTSEILYQNATNNSHVWKKTGKYMLFSKVRPKNSDLPFDNVSNTQAKSPSGMAFSIKAEEGFNAVAIAKCKCTELALYWMAGNTRKATTTLKIDGVFTRIIEKPQSALSTDSVEIVLLGDSQLGEAFLCSGDSLGHMKLDFAPRIEDLSPIEIGKGGEIKRRDGVKLMTLRGTIYFPSSEIDEKVRLLREIGTSVVAIDASGKQDHSKKANFDYYEFDELQMVGIMKTGDIVVNADKNEIGAVSSIQVEVQEAG